MKTLDEVIKEYAIECGCLYGGNICAMDIEGVKEVANRFAKSVAQQALEKAAEKAGIVLNEFTVNKEVYGRWIGKTMKMYFINDGANVSVDKSSITNPDNMPTL